MLPTTREGTNWNTNDSLKYVKGHSMNRLENAAASDNERSWSRRGIMDTTTGGTEFMVRERSVADFRIAKLEQ